MKWKFGDRDQIFFKNIKEFALRNTDSYPFTGTRNTSEPKNAMNCQLMHLINQLMKIINRECR